jgi:hypothetical protein
MITPSDSASSPEDYAAVTPHGRGPAPYEIQAPQMGGEIAAAYGDAGAASGAGIVYPRSPRQDATEQLIMSPPGYADFDILSGSASGWPADVSPPGA